MVERLNFGGGEEQDDPEEGKSKKKTRKEVFEEIIEKSRSYDAARKEMKMVTDQVKNELDADYQNLLQLLKYRKDTVNPEDAMKNLKKPPQAGGQQSYDEIAASLKNAAKQAPIKVGQLTEKEQAMARKKKLQELEKAEAENEEQSESEGEKVNKKEDEKNAKNRQEISKKRENKLETKRDFAVARLQGELTKEAKNETKAGKAEQELRAKLEKVGQKRGRQASVDNDLLS